MALVIVQPYSNKDAKEHYLNTIEKKVSITNISKYIQGDLLVEIKNKYGENGIPVWGVKPGGKNVNIKKWERVEPGDIVLFSANKKISVIGTVVFKTHNRELAKFLWGEDVSKQTWEYIYFLDELKSVDIPVEDFNRIVEYEPNNNIQGFNVLNEEKSENFLSHFELFSDKIIEDVSEAEYNKTLDSFDTLDKKVLSSARKEQQFLRKQLFNNKLKYKCGICGKTYPVEFLVASHIKKRSLCTINEQKDWKNIVMPMCKFGCDDLYEKGYVNIENGTVKIVKFDTPDLNKYMNSINGNKCDYWNDGTKVYFEFHNNMKIK